MLGRQPVITGAGIVCAAGCGLTAVWDAVRAGRSGLGPLTLFASPRFGHHLVGQIHESVEALAGPVRGSRSDKLAWIAAREAVQVAGLSHRNPRRADRWGVAIGATTGGMLGTETFLHRWLRERKHRFGPLRFHECASATDLLARRLGAQGPTTTFSTACSAGALAIAAAGEWIESGEADLVLAGGCDSLCRLTLNGFGSLLLLDPHGCRPFDAARSGISLGEAAALLVIEAEDSARSRGAPVLGRLAGWGSSCDAFHPTAPHPEGDGAVAAMSRALARSGLRASDIDYVSAHGTGTPDNDAVEAKALRRLFGETPPPVSSIQRFVGHTLAASGALKAVLSLLALREQAIPPSLGLERPDPSLGFEPVRDCRPARLGHVLSNSFGFGGNNVALVFAHPDTRPAHPRTPSSAGRVDPPFSGGDPASARPPGSTPIRAEPQSPAAQRLAVLGAGIVSSAGCRLADFQAAFTQGGAPCVDFEVHPADPPARVPVMACRDFGPDPWLDAARLRRLSRLQQMVLVAAHRSLPAGWVADARSDRVCVAFGTGLGALNDTAAFVENLILKDERSPRPLLFTNSVHNSLASQVALEFGLRGLNCTVTDRETSFEAALWHGTRELRGGGADRAVVGAADELSPYLLAAGLRAGWWDPPAPNAKPFGPPGPGRRRVWAGEGCAVFTLSPPRPGTEALAWVSAVRLGRVRRISAAELDAEAEADWIQSTLEREGESLADVDVLLTGASGAPADDRAYAAVAGALSRQRGREMPCGAFKHCCGEFPSASAFGFAAALRLVRGEILPLQCGVGSDLAERPCRKVVLYTVASSGAKGMCCVSA